MSEVDLSGAISKNDLPLHPRKKKKIIICCDGTGNDFVHTIADLKKSSNSNVVKLYTALSKSDDQFIYYHPGVGTMGAPTATHWITKQWSRIKGLAFGAGFRDNVFSAYRFLMEQYSTNGGDGNDGLQDDVYIFGFSRGSYTARALTGLLDGYGLLCPGNEDHLPYAWRMFTSQLADPKIRKRKSVVPNEAFRETYSQNEFPITFMGLWDTVSSVGWIYTPLQLLDIAQNRLLTTVRHAVSIDEHRCFYQDNLYGEPLDPNDPDPQKRPLSGQPQDILQVWFSGVHSDIGGSYPQRETYFALQTLEWMMAHASAAGLKYIDEDHVNLVLSRPTEKQYWCSALYSGIQAPPKDHILHKSLKWLWWLVQFCPHRYYDRENDTPYYRVPFAVRRIIPRNSLISSLVRGYIGNVRLGGKPYNPTNLKAKYLVPTPQPDNTPSLFSYDVYEPPPRGFSFWHWFPVRWFLNGVFFILFWAVFIAILSLLLSPFVLLLGVVIRGLECLTMLL